MNVKPCIEAGCQEPRAKGQPRCRLHRAVYARNWYRRTHVARPARTPRRHLRLDFLGDAVALEAAFKSGYMEGREDVVLQAEQRARLDTVRRSHGLSYRAA